MDSGALGQVELETLLSKTSLSVATCDALGRLTFLSPALKEMFGLADEGLFQLESVDGFELYDASGSSRLRPEDVPLSRALRGEVVKDALIAVRVDSDNLVFLRCNAAPLLDRLGQLTGAVVLAQDVTAEQTATFEQEELRNRLVVTINHELRTPLTKLLGHAELLRDADDLLAARRSLDVVWSAANELTLLLHTISDLLDLEAHARLAKTDTDVAGLVREIAADFSTSDRGVRVVAEAPETLSATLDPKRIRRAIVELMDNAATYSPGDAEVQLRLTGDSATVKVSVCDFGTGIRPKDRHRLLQPFERGDHPQQPINGKGLGLAIAHTVAAAHGGQLTLSEREPHGLCGTLLLPRDGTLHD